MAKGKSKGKKLGLIIAELTSLTGEMKKLVKQQAALAAAVGKLSSGKPAGSVKSKPAAKTPRPVASRAGAKPARPVEKAKPPVLVTSSEQAKPVVHVAPQKSAASQKGVA